MEHKHDVIDADPRFKIDGTTRVITNVAAVKKTLIQGDHNSERLTFELPKVIDGHDMSACDSVKIHFLNIEASTKKTNAGIYDVEDFAVDQVNEDVVTFSWLISRNATKYVGNLSFRILFSCITDDSVDYSWSTAIYSDIAIQNTIDNTEVIFEDYVDVLLKWKNELFGINNEGLTDVQNAAKEGVDQIEKTGSDILKEMTEKGDAVSARSWAVGGTGTRDGENTNNARYYSGKAADEAGKAKEYAESVGKNIDIVDTHDISGQGKGAKLKLQAFLDHVGNWLVNKVVTNESFSEKFVEALSEKLKNDGVTTDEGHALDARYGKTLTDKDTELEKSISENVKTLSNKDLELSTSIQKIHTIVPVTLIAAGWTGSAAPYTQIVQVKDLTANDNPILVSLLEDGANLDKQKAYNKAYGLIASGTGVSGAGTMTFKVYKKPAIDVTVGLTCLRGKA